MITRISSLKSKTNLPEVKSLCEQAISMISNTVYNHVTSDARKEIETIAIENLFEALSKYPNDEITSSWLASEKRMYTIKNLGIYKSINTLLESEAKYLPTLEIILEDFKDRLKEKSEISLYEAFISSLSGFNYLPTVTTELEAVSGRVKKYKNDIDISKILETMKETTSYYLLPHIEDVINDYIVKKDEQTKHFLKETLNKFSYDPFVRDILNLVHLDATNLQLEYATATCDIEKIYSPIMYLGENETLFNVKGMYYIKKGNSINKVKRSEYSKIDRSFTSLCEQVNADCVVINRDDIKIYMGSDKAVISSDKLFINEQQIDKDKIADLNQLSNLKPNQKFYNLTESLKNNFDEIAEIDFVKRVYLKENDNFAADVFKVRDNIFITTHDPINNKETFYKNINPIQAKNIMMEHLRFDITKTFESLLPTQEKILSEIDETKRSYSDFIAALTQKLSEAQNLSFSIRGQVLEALNEELDAVKNEYKDYLNTVEAYIRPMGNIDEGITITIDDNGQKYIVPIPVSNGQEGATKSNVQGAETGATVVGAENVGIQNGVMGTSYNTPNEMQPSANVTFNDDETELLGDSPSIQADEVDMGADEVEGKADQAELEKQKSDELMNEPEEGGASADGTPTEPGTGAESSIEGGEQTPEQQPTEVPTSGTESTPEEGGNSDELSLEPENPEETDEDKEKKKEGEEDEEEEKKNESLTRTSFVQESRKPRIFLKKKLNESKNVLTEDAQIGDTVTFDKNQKGFITGKANNGDLLIMNQLGSTTQKKQSEVKVKTTLSQNNVKPSMKFDTQTQKVLFEQLVRCGIFEGTIPIKTSNCYVKYNEWKESNMNEQVCVIIEGTRTFCDKNRIKIFEELNDFANLDNYVEGAIIDESTGEARYNALINSIDYVEAIGGADNVRVIVERDGKKRLETFPKAQLKTLSI